MGLKYLDDALEGISTAVPDLLTRSRITAFMLRIQFENRRFRLKAPFEGEDSSDVLMWKQYFGERYEDLTTQLDDDEFPVYLPVKSARIKEIKGVMSKVKDGFARESRIRRENVSTQVESKKGAQKSKPLKKKPVKDFFSAPSPSRIGTSPASRRAKKSGKQTRKSKS